MERDIVGRVKRWRDRVGRVKRWREIERERKEMEGDTAGRENK